VKKPHLSHLAYLLLISLLLPGCVDDFINLQDDLADSSAFEISTDLLHNPVILQVVDLETGETPQQVEISVIRSDFSELYSLAGSSTLRPLGGILPLGIRKTEIPVGGMAASMELRFEAPGYFPTTQQFIVADSSTQLYNITMKSTALGEDIAELEERFSTNRQRNLIFNDDANSIDVLLERNTTLLNENGDTLRGNARLRVKAFEGSAENKRFLSEELDDAAFINNDGSTGKFRLDPLNVMDINIRVGNQEATQLTYPLVVRVPIPADLISPLTNETIQAGDFIPAFSLNENRAAWQTDGFAIVEERNGRLEAELELPHLSRWAIGFAEVSSKVGTAEECQVYIYLRGDTQDTIRGSYVRRSIDTVYVTIDDMGTRKDSTVYRYDTIPYEYTRRPSRCFIDIFPGCMTGTGFDLAQRVRQAKREAREYYLRQDSTVFRDLKFEEDVRVYVVYPPEVCDNYQYQEDRTIPLRVNADEEVTGFLSYYYANVYTWRQVTLRKGANSFAMPYPTKPFIKPDNYFRDEGYFSFYYYDDCNYESAEVRRPDCEVQEGISFRVRSPQPVPPSSVDINVTAVCKNGDSDLIVRPSFPLLYRRHCNTPGDYLLMGEVKDGVLRSATQSGEEDFPMQPGHSYDFKMKFGETLREIEDIVIPRDSATYIINGIPISVTVDNRTIQMDLGEVEIPDEVCDLLGG